MVCDQPFSASYQDQFIQKVSALSIIINRINGTSFNYHSDSDIPWKFCTSKAESFVLTVCIYFDSI